MKLHSKFYFITALSLFLNLFPNDPIQHPSIIIEREKASSIKPFIYGTVFGMSTIGFLWIFRGKIRTQLPWNQATENLRKELNTRLSNIEEAQKTHGINLEGLKKDTKEIKADTAFVAKVVQAHLENNKPLAQKALEQFKKGCQKLLWSEPQHPTQ